MSKKIAITVFFCLFCLIQSAKGQSILVEEAGIARCCTEDDLRRDIGFLASDMLEGRGTASKGSIFTSFFLMERFRSLGLHPFDGSFSLSFPCCDKIGHNAIAMLEGIAGSPSSRYIIIGAHFDNLGIMGDKIFPGADSNGSGVAALLGIAKMMAGQRKYGKTYGGNVIFVAFDGFYDGRKGSQALWDAIKTGKLKDPVSGRTITPSNINLMIDLDQMGTVFEPVNPERKDFLIAVGNNTLPESKRLLLDICNRAYGFNFDLNYDYYHSKRFTELFYRLGDRRYFIDNNIPTLFITSGITDFNNSVLDCPDTIEYNILKRRTIFIFRFIENFL